MQQQYEQIFAMVHARGMVEDLMTVMAQLARNDTAGAAETFGKVADYAAHAREKLLNPTAALPVAEQSLEVQSTTER